MKKLKTRFGKKGVTSLEIVVSVMIVLVILSGFIDLTQILSRSNAVSVNTAYVSRVVGSQGGVQNSVIRNFSGRYVTANELYSNINRSMRSSGISEDEWEVRIHGVKLTPITNLPIYDYGSRIPIDIVVDYKWGMTNNFVPGDLEGTHESKNIVSTTYKIRDGGFRQE